MNQLVLENCRIPKNNSLEFANVGISNGSIREISAKKISGKKTINCGQKILMPGIIDCHVHFRTPGAEFEEDWSTATRGCVSSGITTVLEMPNTNPQTTTIKTLNQKRKIAQKNSLANFGFHFGATGENEREIQIATRIGSVKVFIGKSTGNLFVEKKERIKKVFEIAKKRNLVVCVHAEDQKIIQRNERKFKNVTDPMIHSKIRTAESEANAIEMVLELQRKAENKLHICHVSSKQGIQLIKEAKDDRPLVSCEVTPHHLFFTEKDLAKLHNLGKVNPSIKNERDKNALWKGIKDGTVDCVASDHAPHLLEEKKQGYWSAPAGMPGVETIAPLMINFALEKKLSLERVTELLCENPAKIFGIKNKGVLKKGFDADLIIFDLDKQSKVQNSKLFTKCKWSAFNSLKLKGVLEKTIIGGQIVFENKVFFKSSSAKEVF